MQRAAGLSAAEPSSFSLFASYKKGQLAGRSFCDWEQPHEAEDVDIPKRQFAVT